MSEEKPPPQKPKETTQETKLVTVGSCWRFDSPTEEYSVFFQIQHMPPVSGRALVLFNDDLAHPETWDEEYFYNVSEHELTFAQPITRDQFDAMWALATSKYKQ